MFNLKKRVEKLERIQQIKDKPDEEVLYKFYLDRKIDEINAKIENKMSYEIVNEEELTATWMLCFPRKIILIRLGDVEIKRIEEDRRDIFNTVTLYKYKEILKYINSKSISYFIKLDKKIIDLKNELKEQEEKYNRQKKNITEEIKKYI